MKSIFLAFLIFTTTSIIAQNNWYEVHENNWNRYIDGEIDEVQLYLDERILAGKFDGINELFIIQNDTLKFNKVPHSNFYIELNDKSNKIKGLIKNDKNILFYIPSIRNIIFDFDNYLLINDKWIKIKSINRKSFCGTNSSRNYLLNGEILWLYGTIDLIENKESLNSVEVPYKLSITININGDNQKIYSNPINIGLTKNQLERFMFENKLMEDN